MAFEYLLNDTYTGAGTRTYDAENRMTTAADYTGQISRYTYDADGRRVRVQVASSQEKWQVYGLGGELLAEYQASSPSSAPEKEYGYRDGELLVTATGRFNVALAANGAVATASSANTCCGFSTTGAINGNYRGPWGNGEGWNDATQSVVPDWIQVDFAGSKTIDEINVFGLHDNYTQENTPTQTQTFTLYGLLAFDVQYWNGSTWVTVPAASVTGNNKVRLFTFSPITTSKIRVWINTVPDAWSRVVEIQAFGTSASGEKVQWLVPDHLGTPRMIVDQTGTLANLKRHDYLPFGEELFAGSGGRTVALGYGGGDGVRQQFTSKERDVETGLDYFGARYYASPQGRFTGADPLLSSGRLEDPQTWNRYSYTLNNPLCLLDPTGMFTISSSVKDQTDRDKIIEAYNKLNEALTKLTPGSKAYKSIERSLARLGKPGVANGVVVTIGKLSSPHTGGQTDPQRIDKAIVTITLNSDNFSTRSTEEVASTLGHEGVHADDDFNLWAKTGSMSAFSKIYNSNAFVYQTEYDAFFASAGVYQTLLPDSVSTWGRYEIPAAPGKARNLLERYNLWNPSWKTLDLKQIEAKQSETIQTKLEAPRNSSMRGYGLRRPRNFQP